MSEVLTVTVNPTVDRNTSTEHVGPNRKLRCEQPTVEPGGGGINVSRAVHILGGESTAVYAAGGRTGARLSDLLVGEGVDHQSVSIEEETRQNLIVLDRTSGEQYRFGMPGPRVSLQEQEALLEAVEKSADSAEYLVASGSLARDVPSDYYARVARIGRKAGAKVVVDVSGSPLIEAVEEGLFLIKPNVRELDDIAGRELHDDAERVREIRSLMKRGKVELVVLSLGRGGSLLVTKDEERRFRSPSVQVKSRIGAGDSMVAGIVLKLAAGGSIDEAVMYGSAAGASAVMTPGTELCRKETTEKLYQALRSEEQL